MPDTQLVDGEDVMRTARRVKTPAEIALIRAAATVAEATVMAALEAVAAGASDAAVKAVAMEAMAAQAVTTAALEPRISRDDMRATVAVGVLRDGWEADLTRRAPGRDRPDVLTAAIDRCRAGAIVSDLGADVHGLGLGYEVLSPSDVLEPGMVLSVGAGGGRDTVIVTDGAPVTCSGPH
ncbi:MAG: hypothetical protein E6G57_16850 [Actinobacteria bacterium]|nr:MAG: hypothetical protein E6G57_16850 [Actinomycetota bacterium]